MSSVTTLPALDSKTCEARALIDALKDAYNVPSLNALAPRLRVTPKLLQSWYRLNALSSVGRALLVMHYHHCQREQAT